MPRDQNSSQNAYSVYKNVHCKDENKVPNDALLLEMVKPLEIRIQQRQSSYQCPSYPLWFLAETEKNVYLWRNNKSLIEQDDFQFWIAPEELIDKRIQQLEDLDPSNIFHNLDGAWHHFSSEAQREEERVYFRMVLQIYDEIRNHAEALSHVSAIVQSEEHIGKAKKHVVLPYQRT